MSRPYICEGCGRHDADDDGYCVNCGRTQARCNPSAAPECFPKKRKKGGRRQKALTATRKAYFKDL